MCVYALLYTKRSGSDGGGGGGGGAFPLAADAAGGVAAADGLARFSGVDGPAPVPRLAAACSSICFCTARAGHTGCQHHDHKKQSKTHLSQANEDATDQSLSGLHHPALREIVYPTSHAVVLCIPTRV